MTRSNRPIDYSPEQLIKNTAYEVGFSEAGIASVAPSRQSREVFDRWLEDGRHGHMRYLSGGRGKRHNPAFVEGARSVISVALNYFSPDVEDEMDALPASRGRFAMYAQARDYHKVMLEMLTAFEERLRQFFPAMKAYATVDTQPISERDYAIQAGIAWLGKNTMVISPEYGSWIFLGELFTDLELRSDQPLETMCGSCRRCIDACPTGALDEPFTMDATRCISYLTIEKRGELSEDDARDIVPHVFGCDECQRVCPFNAHAQPCVAFDYGHRNPLVTWSLHELAGIDDDTFRELTRESAIRRCKAEGLRRNARAVAAGRPE